MGLNKCTSSCSWAPQAPSIDCIHTWRVSNGQKMNMEKWFKADYSHPMVHLGLITNQAHLTKKKTTFFWSGQIPRIPTRELRRSWGPFPLPTVNPPFGEIPNNGGLVVALYICAVWGSTIHMECSGIEWIGNQWDTSGFYGWSILRAYDQSLWKTPLVSLNKAGY